MIALSLFSLLLASTALATPWRRDSFRGKCTDSNSNFTIPTGLDSLKSSPNLVLVGVGIQNYTCSANRNFTNIGAVAQLFDISCLGKVEFNTIQNDSFAAWNTTSSTDPLNGELAQKMQAQFNLTVIGQHYFQNETGVLTPIWDLRAEEPFKGNAGAFVATHKVKAIPSPNGPSDITWVELAKNSDQNSGQLASTVYRIDTVAGQPAASCCPGDSSIVKYTAKYLLL